MCEGAWVFAQPLYMCFMNLKKGYDYVQSGWGVLGWVFLVYEPFVALLWTTTTVSVPF